MANVAVMSSKIPGRYFVIVIDISYDFPADQVLDQRTGLEKDIRALFQASTFLDEGRSFMNYGSRNSEVVSNALCLCPSLMF